MEGGREGEREGEGERETREGEGGREREGGKGREGKGGREGGRETKGWRGGEGGMDQWSESTHAFHRLGTHPLPPPLGILLLSPVSMQKIVFEGVSGTQRPSWRWPSEKRSSPIPAE